MYDYSANAGDEMDLVEGRFYLGGKVSTAAVPLFRTFHMRILLTIHFGPTNDFVRVSARFMKMSKDRQWWLALPDDAAKGTTPKMIPANYVECV